jgi:S-formylglutathione hydrolase FrmB
MQHSQVAHHPRTVRWLAIFPLLILGSVLAALAPAEAGVLEELTIQSAALSRPVAAFVYLPDGTAPKHGWPVLYLLHGLNGSCRDWPTLGGIKETLDELVAARRIKPMIVVMPDAGNSWYVNSASYCGPGDYETAMLDDLPRAIEQKFAVRQDREGRAIAGLSMGGYGALRLALSRPDRYVAAASLSGAIWQNIPKASPNASTLAGADGQRGGRQDEAKLANEIDLPPGGDHFGRAFGAPFDADRFDAANVFTLLDRQLKRGADIPAIYLTVGDHDSHGLWRGSIALFETLMEDHVAVDFRVTGGDHVWSLWKQTIGDALVFVDSKFGAPPSDKIAGGVALPKFANGVAIVK